MAYQWYKDNTPIEGATSSILYEELDFNAEYSVLLTREDGVQEMVCAIKPIQFGDISGNTVVVFGVNTSSQVNVKASESAEVRVWSSLGMLVGEYFIDKGENVLNLGNNSGLYIFEFIFTDGRRSIERIVL